jgi:hypothetical protein
MRNRLDSSPIPLAGRGRGCGRLAALLVALAVTTIACDQGSAPAAGPTEDTLPGGAIVVRNRASAGWDDAERWELVEDLRIGEAEGDPSYLFGRVAGVEVDDEGTIYVLDGQAREVKVYDASGTFLRSFGRPGEGPGELTGPQALFWGPEGHLWVHDPRAARFTAFTTDGDLVDTRRREAVGFRLPWAGGFLPSGRLVDRIEFQAGMDAPVEQSFVIAAGPEDAAADTVRLPLHEQRFVRSTGPRAIFFAVPFGPRRHMAFDPAGGVWIAISDDYRIVRVALPSGDTTRIVELDAPAAPLPDHMADGVLEDMRRRGVELGRADLPDALPYITGLTVADDGSLWVHRSMVKPDTVDVFGPEGHYRGWLATEVSALPPPVIVGDHVYSIERGAMDVPEVVRWRINRHRARTAP